MAEFLFRITEEYEEYETVRIDKCIQMLMENRSRSYIQKLIKENKILVNNLNVKSNYLVKGNDEISISIPDAIEPDIIPENLSLDVLYEDTDVLVVNKPKGMVVHPAAGHFTGTLVNAVMYYCKDQLSGINGIMRPGIVHRIDMNTTGSVIICKNDVAHASIAKQLKEHSITRKYHAIVCGNLKDQTGTIDAPIGRNENDRKKMAINRNGREAVTHYTLLKQYQDYAYIECQLETGRTHQIRVHMASIGHPLLGDDIYNNRKSPFKLNGQTLHAYIIGFNQPKTGQYIEVIAPLPEYFLHLLEILK
jgi:23S rRNA pseudouridine1911/1915/1917 synthase